MHECVPKFRVHLRAKTKVTKNRNPVLGLFKPFAVAEDLETIGAGEEDQASNEREPQRELKAGKQGGR